MAQITINRRQLGDKLINTFNIHDLPENRLMRYAEVIAPRGHEMVFVFENKIPDGNDMPDAYGLNLISLRPKIQERPSEGSIEIHYPNRTLVLTTVKADNKYVEENAGLIDAHQTIECCFHGCPSAHDTRRY